MKLLIDDKQVTFEIGQKRPHGYIEVFTIENNRRISCHQLPTWFLDAGGSITTNGHKYILETKTN